MNEATNTTHHNPPLSVSTWSLHRALGLTYTDAPDKARDNTGQPTWGPGTVALLDVPARVASLGIPRLEICHFQIPSRDPGYLRDLRGALDAANVELLTVLVDNGDITHPTDADGQRDWIAGWVETAAHLGARRVRVIAGKAAYSPEAMEASKAGMRVLADRAEALGTRIVTENWFDLLALPAHVNELLDSMEGRVGLNGDFGNWEGPTKYEALAQIFDRAESCHAKCAFTGARSMDEEDFGRCVRMAQTAGFSGPYTLIYDGMNDDEWECLGLERDLLQSLYANNAA